MNVVSLLTPKMQVAYLYDDCTKKRQGIEGLRNHGFTAVPVLSREGRYVGTVSEGDFLWHMLDRQDNVYGHGRSCLEGGTRTDFNPAVSVRVSMGELLERAMEQSFVPVVDDRGALWALLLGRQSFGG